MKNLTMKDYLEIKTMITLNNEKLDSLENQLTSIRKALAYLTPDQWDEVADEMNGIKEEMAETNKTIASLKDRISGFLAPAAKVA